MSALRDKLIKQQQRTNTSTVTDIATVNQSTTNHFKPSNKRPNYYVIPNNNGKSNKKHKHNINHSTTTVSSTVADTIRPSKSKSSSASASASASAPTPSRTSVLQAKLSGSQFRLLNEQLYTMSSNKAMKLYESDPKLFNAYHSGYTTQVSQWPINPLSLYISQLLTIKKKLVIADMGCGTAELARTLHDNNSKHTVHSYDLIAHNQYITACNIAHTPLNDSSVDLVIYCLSLMGTDWIRFLYESHRVLKLHGQLYITEVKSRFIRADSQNDHKVIKYKHIQHKPRKHSEQSGIKQFIQLTESIGYQHKSTNDKNTMFVMFTFSKNQSSADTSNQHNHDATILKPCLYKRR